MSLESNYKGLVRSAHTYRDLLSNYSDEVFVQQPSDGSWSRAQVYAHIFTVNLLSMRGLERILNGSAAGSNEKTHWKARWILFSGKFPKGRKVPKSIEERTPTFDKQKAEESIAQFLVKIDELYATRGNWNPSLKLKHTVLGMLNCAQWIRFMQVHSDHHLKQLKRIERSSQL